MSGLCPGDRLSPDGKGRVPELLHTASHRPTEVSHWVWFPPLRSTSMLQTFKEATSPAVGSTSATCVG